MAERSKGLSPRDQTMARAGMALEPRPQSRNEESWHALGSVHHSGQVKGEVDF